MDQVTEGHSEQAVVELTRSSAAVDADAVRGPGTRGIDFLTIASTVGITTVLLPFLQSPVQNAGNDVHKALTGLVRSKPAAAISATIRSGS